MPPTRLTGRYFDQMTDQPAREILPEGPVVVFDGYCSLCNAWVSFLLSHDRQRRFRFATLQGESGQALVARTASAKPAPDSIVLVENRKAYIRSDAALRILGHLGFPWSAAGLFRLVPPQIRDAIYDLVARNRYRWFGRTDSCRVPTPEERSLFLS